METCPVLGLFKHGIRVRLEETAGAKADFEKGSGKGWVETTHLILVTSSAAGVDGFT